MDDAGFPHAKQLVVPDTMGSEKAGLRHQPFHFWFGLRKVTIPYVFNRVFSFFSGQGNPFIHNDFLKSLKKLVPRLTFPKVRINPDQLASRYDDVD